MYLSLNIIQNEFIKPVKKQFKIKWYLLKKDKGYRIFVHGNNPN